MLFRAIEQRSHDQMENIMKQSSTNPAAPRARKLRIGLVTVLAGVAMGGGTAAAAADGTNASTCGYAGRDNNPGSEISQASDEFSGENNPGAGWHLDGMPFVAGFCNPSQGGW